MKKSEKPKTTADNIAEQRYYTREIYKIVRFWHNVGIILLFLWIAGIVLGVVVLVLQ